MSAPSLPPSLRRLVTERAQGKCEYCLKHQDVSIYSHEIDHIIALKHGGSTEADNLALACLSCNRYKGSDLTSFDLISNEVVPLFNPRRQTWTEQFDLDGARIIGITPTGRASVLLLKLNAPSCLLHRHMLIAQERYP
jgi:HNH endonuclease